MAGLRVRLKGSANRPPAAGNERDSPPPDLAFRNDRLVLSNKNWQFITMAVERESGLGEESRGGTLT